MEYWVGQGRGQIGNGGMTYRYCNGRWETARQGYFRPLPDGSRGWVEEAFRPVSASDVPAHIRAHYES